MRRRRGFASVPVWAGVVAWGVSYVVLAAGGLLTPPAVASVLLWAVAAWWVLRPWWPAAGSRGSAIDLPGRLLAVAAAALPERRREWGTAMAAELAGIEGRPARWRFVLSCLRATLWLRPAAGWPLFALVAGMVVAVVAAAGPVVGSVVPGLGVFAASFTGVAGSLMLPALARSHRPGSPLRSPVPAPAVLVTVGVVAAITVTVIFLRREPAAAEYLPAPSAVFLAAVLAGCLWIAVAAPRRLGTDRLAAHLGACAAVVFAAWFWLILRFDQMTLPQPVENLLLPVVGLTPLAVFAGPAFVAGRVGASLRSGLRVTAWTMTGMIPLTYAVWLPESLRRHAIDGRTWDGEIVAPVGVNLADAVIFTLAIFPVFCLVFGILGAGLGARTRIGRSGQSRRVT